MDQTVCFSGYRPEKFSIPLLPGNEQFERLVRSIDAQIAFSVAGGFRNFICGMAAGFDILCGESVLRIKKVFPQVRLVAARPFHAHMVPVEWLERYSRVREQCAEEFVIHEFASRRAYLDRNRFMVDMSQRLICWYDGKPGGTGYTVMYARERGLEIVNLAQQHVVIRNDEDESSILQ